MTRTHKNANGRQREGLISIGKMCDEGLVEAVPCACCHTKTRSHMVVDTGESLIEPESESDFDGFTGEIEVYSVCHSCFKRYEIPTSVQQRRKMFIDDITVDPVLEVAL